mmetsp:Transcript_30817/g.92411  ORF Transcript_30817/g.92411 Transcript_30817/m.92411 type:complete len:278 (-) Transcript_30817:492-1325(-)
MSYDVSRRNSRDEVCMSTSRRPPAIARSCQLARPPGPCCSLGRLVRLSRPMRDQCGMLLALMRCSSTSRSNPRMLCPTITSGSIRAIFAIAKPSICRSDMQTSIVLPRDCLHRDAKSKGYGLSPSLRMAEKCEYPRSASGVGPSQLTCECTSPDMTTISFELVFRLSTVCSLRLSTTRCGDSGGSTVLLTILASSTSASSLHQLKERFEGTAPLMSSQHGPIRSRFMMKRSIGWMSEPKTCENVLPDHSLASTLGNVPEYTTLSHSAERGTSCLSKA